MHQLCIIISTEMIALEYNILYKFLRSLIKDDHQSPFKPIRDHLSKRYPTHQLLQDYVVYRLEDLPEEIEAKMF